MGVTEREGYAAGLECGVDYAGCAQSTKSGGVVKSALVGVWLVENDWWNEVGLLNETIRHTTIHEVLHAMLAVGHRAEPGSMMDVEKSLSLTSLSPMDEALFRLHSHPMVEPGMTLDEVEALIVFADELLEPPTPVEPDAYEIVRSAFAELQKAGSARFRINGGWRGANCESGFGEQTPATLEIADFTPASARFFHFQDEPNNFYMAYSSRAGQWYRWREAVRQGSGQWQAIDSNVMSELSGWRSGFTEPHRMLASLLHFAGPDDIKLKANDDGSVTLSADLERAYMTLTWAERIRLTLAMTLDADTHHIRGYRMDWSFRTLDESSCDLFVVVAEDGEYGVKIEVPNAIGGAGLIGGG